MDDWEDLLSTPFRDRSNTWPRCTQIKPAGSPPPSVPDIIEEPSEVPTDNVAPAPRIKQRRNVWGNKSYAELITEAILSTNEKRMMLSEIYNWMIKNVDCFKDKQADNSSAGWKNSIRHNLSLHDCFMHLPNEQTGKSNWWVLNPNSKSTKMHRRRLSVHHNPVMDFDNPDEHFRRRTKSDCSSCRRPSQSPSSRYSPNCSTDSYISDCEKEEASHILDSLIEIMKKENVNPCSFPRDTCFSSNCNIEMIKQETNIVVSSVIDALKIEREGNKYLEAVEPISSSSTLYTDLDFVSSSGSEYSTDAMSPFPDACIMPQNHYPANCAGSYPNSIHPSVLDSHQQTTKTISCISACNSKGQQWLQPTNMGNKKEEGTFQDWRKQNEFELKEPKGACNWSFDNTVDFTSGVKQSKNEDSIGRPRSKSYSGFIQKRRFTNTARNDATSNTKVTPCFDSVYLDLEELLLNNYEELSLQDIEPWAVNDEWQSTTLISSSLNT